MVSEISESTAAPRTTADYFKRLGPTGLLALAAFFLPMIASVMLAWYIEPLSQWLRNDARMGPPLYVAVFIVAGGLSLMPTHIYSALGGWAFGFPVGFSAAMIGYLGAAMVAYGIGRVASGQRVVAIFHEKPKLRAVYDELIRSHPLRALLLVTLIRLTSSPFAVTNLVFAAARVPLWVYFTGTAIGLSVRTGIIVAVFSRLQGQSFHYTQHKWLLWGGIPIAIVVVLIVAQVAQRAIDHVTTDFPTNPPGQK